MPITPSSLAVARGAGVNNQAFTPTAQDIPRNIVIIGTFNPSLAASITVETVYGPYSNAAQIGAVFGQGYMIHRLACGVFAGAPSGGVTVWVIPQAEVGGAVAGTHASGIVVSGPSTGAGTLAVYVDNIRYAISVTSGMTATQIADAIVAAWTADPNCPVSGVDTTGTIAVTSKSKGPWGNSIPIAINIQAGDSLPAGVTVTLNALATGSGVPTIANALNNGLGTGTNANTLPNGWWMTDLVHGYLASGTTAAATAQDQTTITAISTYNGLASAASGCYDHNVGKPFRCINGDVTNSATVPSALVTFGSTNSTTDRTNAILCVAGSRTHPCEMAAVATGAVNVRAGSAALRPYDGITLPGVDPGPTGMWTTDYGNRDTAVKAGLSPTIVVGGAVTLQNIVTFYAANTQVPQTSNGYREWVNLCKLQNIIYSMLSNFRGPKWQGFTIVVDATKVSDPVAKQYVRDVNSVIDDLVALAKAWYGKGWVYSKDFIINALMSTTNPPVVPRTAGDGFTVNLPGILSGIGNIIDATFNFDISLAGVTS